MKFFFDRNMSVHIARMINHFDRKNNVVHQDDDSRFEDDSEDTFIIEELSRERPKPVWITADLSQRRKRTASCPPYIALVESGSELQ